MLPIDMLDNAVETSFLIKRAARSQEEVSNWQKYPYNYFSEHYAIKKLDDRNLIALKESIEYWDRLQMSLFRLLEIDANKFIQTFLSIRNGFVNSPSEIIDQASYLGSRTYNHVRNISWVILFCNHLPQSVPDGMRNKVCEVGINMASIFYLELLNKLIEDGHLSGVEPIYFSKLDALWQRAAGFGCNHLLLDKMYSENEYEFAVDEISNNSI